eukprot:scaffold5865_cov186-Amphora_coffeaeformis.AAC.16
MWKSCRAMQHVLHRIGGERRMTQSALVRRGGANHPTINAQLRAVVHRRTYMDVHQRPSHSGMFQRGGVDKIPPPVTPPPPPEDAAESSAASLYTLLLSRAAMAAGIIYVVTEYMCDITLCEGPSMSPTLKPAGEIVLIDKWTLRRYGVADGCRGVDRMRAALERQEAFVQSAADNEDIWHAPRVSVSDLDPPTWSDLWQMLTTPLSVGDVVVVNHPSRKGTVCKRVVGLPGDTVVKPRSGLLVIPDGHVWLEGDNPVK